MNESNNRMMLRSAREPDCGRNTECDGERSHGCGRCRCDDRSQGQQDSDQRFGKHDREDHSSDNENNGDEDATDPLRRGPHLWFHPLDPAKPGRGRTHIDVSVPRDVAEARVAAAVAAGGRIARSNAVS